MLNLLPVQTALLKGSLFRYATCWTITRTDGLILRYTDHNQDLTLADGFTYRMAASVKASARQKQLNLKTQNMEMVGFLDASSITNDDLRAGLYREAQIREQVVDWKYPWIPSLLQAKYWISEVSFNNETWEAQIQGLTRWLRGAIGDVYGRLCRWDLGDSRCQVSIVTYTTTGNAITALNPDEPRAFFETDLTEVNDYWSNGLLTWETGNNAGLSFEISAYDNTDGRLRLHLECPYEVQIGDLFTCYPGCNKSRNHCKGVDGSGERPWPNNIANFGGFPDMPGTDKMLQTPNAH